MTPPALSIPRDTLGAWPTFVGLSGDRLVLIDDYQHIRVLGVNTGEELWRRTPAFGFTPYLCGEILLGQESAYRERQLGALAISVSTGEVLWERPDTEVWGGTCRAARTALYFERRHVHPSRLVALTGQVSPLDDGWRQFDVDEHGVAYGSGDDGGKIYGPLLKIRTLGTLDPGSGTVLFERAVGDLLCANHRWAVLEALESIDVYPIDPAHPASPQERP